MNMNSISYVPLFADLSLQTAAKITLIPVIDCHRFLMLHIAFTCLLHVAYYKTPSPYQGCTFSAPSSLHACISLAPSLHDNRAVYAVSMRVSRIINLRNPELLFLP
jgi:hypothetical protein